MEMGVDTMKLETDEDKLNTLAKDYALKSCGGRGAVVNVTDIDTGEIMWAGTLAYVTDEGYAGIIAADTGKLDEVPAAQVFAAMGSVTA